MADLTPQEWRERVEARPLPGDGPTPWEQYGSTSDEAYEAAAQSLAQALLVVAQERPELLDVTAEDERDPTGFAAATNDKLLQAAKDRWPNLEDWLGGLPSVGVGSAHEIVRYVLGAPPAGNAGFATLEINQ
jgi:hypothetical protein